MPDFIYINAGLPSIKSATMIKKYLDDAYSALSIALSLFGREEEDNAFNRLQGRFTAFNLCRDNLDKALMYFPKDTRLGW